MRNAAGAGRVGTPVPLQSYSVRPATLKGV